MTTGTERRWTVACEDFISKPYPLEAQAQARANVMNHEGNCARNHVVVELVKVEGRTGWFTPEGRQAR